MPSHRLRPPGRPPRPDQPAIGDRLKDLRLFFGWSQERLSERTGLRRTEVSLIEQGRNKGSSWRVRMWLAKGFGVSPEVLNAYWDRRTTLQEVAAKIQAAGVVPLAGGRSGSDTQDPLARYPNLRDAVEIVGKYAKIDSESARKAAVAVASGFGTGVDHDTFHWARLLEAELGRAASGSRPSPRSIPNLVTAIELVAQHRAIDRSLIEDAAGRVLRVQKDPGEVSIVQWIVALEDELSQPGKRAARTEGAPRKKRKTARR